MDFREVRNIARYESRMISRGILWRIFVFIAVGVTIYLLFPKLIYHFWADVALDSSIPYMVSYYFNLLQTLIVVFIVYSFVRAWEKRDAMEVIDVYPAGNGERTMGYVGAIVKLILVLNVVVLLIAALFQALFYQGTLSLWINVFYLLTLTLPTLVFVLGLSLFVMRVVKIHFLALLLLLGYLLLTYFFLSEIGHGVFDPWGRVIPNVFSGYVGHVGLAEYLPHRIGYLLIGIGLICLSVWSMPRLPNARRPGRACVWGGICSCLIGLLLMAGFLRIFTESESTREKYRALYARYAKELHATVSEHHIDYFVLPDGYRATSRLMLKNGTGQDLETLLLFLNPGLRVKRLDVEGEAVASERDGQVLKVKYPLVAGDSVRLFVEYEGEIDDRVCYLDIPSSDFYQTKSSMGKILRTGRQLAYCSPEFTFLHPECLWYPVAVPPLNLEIAFVREVHFTDYRLNVYNAGGQTVISQGKAVREGDRISHTPAQCHTGLSLTIGNYLRRSMMIDSVEFEIYYFPESEYLIKEYDDWEKVEGDEAKEVQLVRTKRWVEEAHIRRKYPFERLAFVEIPVSFTAHSRWWVAGSSYSQPEMIFIPERGTESQFLSITHQKLYYSSSIVHMDNQVIEMRREPNITSSFFGGLSGGLFDVSKQAGEFSNYVSSTVYPAINFVMESLMRLNSRFDYEFSDDSHLEMVEYFDKHSPKESLGDSSQAKVSKRYLAAKLIQLQGKIALYVDWAVLYGFMEDFYRQARGRTCDFEEFRSGFEELSGVDLGPIFDEWYDSRGMSSLILKDIRYERADDDIYAPRLKVSFKVYNPSSVDGVISLIGQDGFYADEGLSVKSFLIRPGECKEIKEIGPFVTQHLITTGLSYNVPADFHFNPTDYRFRESPVARDLSTGVTDIDPGEFFPKKGEYIVDNTDEGFHLIDSVGGRRKLADFFKKDEIVYKGISSLEEKRWREIIMAELYGGILRNAFAKLAGNGQLKAEWNQELPEEGEYEVFFYHTPIDNTGTTENHGKGAELYYTVSYGEESKEVVVDLSERMEGWISLGKYYFPAGTKATVVLDDRGCTFEPDPRFVEAGWEIPPKKQMIVADAVKWVKK